MVKLVHSKNSRHKWWLDSSIIEFLRVPITLATFRQRVMMEIWLLRTIILMEKVVWKMINCLFKWNHTRREQLWALNSSSIKLWIQSILQNLILDSSSLSQLPQQSLKTWDSFKQCSCQQDDRVFRRTFQTFSCNSRRSISWSRTKTSGSSLISMTHAPNSTQPRSNSNPFSLIFLRSVTNFRPNSRNRANSLSNSLSNHIPSRSAKN